MPIYEYAPVSRDCGQCHGRFEVFQRMADDKLTQCPTCAQPCERLISAVALGGKYSVTSAGVEKAGFTKYEKTEKGVYERTAGKGGPPVLYK